MEQSPNKMPPQAQQMIGKLQQQQQQLQQMEEQKMELRAHKMQIDRAIEALEETDDGEDVFKVVGPAVIKTEKGNFLEDLKETQETLEIKLDSIDKKEGKIEEDAKKNQEKLRDLMSGGDSGEAG